jgi:hypothetical protein
MTPTRRPGIIRTAALAPFELAFALLAVWSGVSGLFGWTQQATLFNYGLPVWLATLSNLLYTVAGLAILGGHIHRSRQLEAGGLVILASSLVIRAGVLVWLVGITELTVGVVVSAALFLGSIVMRMWVLISGRAVSIIEPARQSDVAEGIVGKVY